MFHNSKVKRWISITGFFGLINFCVVPICFKPASSTEPTIILVLGDSLAAGYGLRKQDTFPVKLERALESQGRSVRVLNAGVSGDTSAGGRSRLNWAVADNPHIVILELGANDGLRGLNPSETKTNLNAIITSLTRKGIAVLLAGMFAPPNLGKGYVKEFNLVYSELAAKHQVAFYNFFLEGVANQPHLNQADGIHPNASGVDEIVRRILPNVITLLNAQ